MKRLLVVDDDREFLALVCKFLEGSSYDCIKADTLDAAIKHVDGTKWFAGALVDFWIGEENAIPLLDVLHSLDPSLPVVLVSGGGGGLTLEKTQAIGEISGAMYFLQKPFRKAELVALLDQIT
ncbi:MAG: response regulator [Paracoccaceae bacterium]|nr:response regulator [Paracoccaceae bacterium]